MKNEKKPNSYKEVAEIPAKLKEKLPSSFDVVGSILLIKLDIIFDNYKNEIANALLKSHKNIKTICQIYPVSGEFRTRKIEIIGGIESTETIHKEYGLKFYVDVKRTYFSSRLANERKRIMEQVKKDEIIVDMFTGVAPFSVMIAKYASPKIIYAFDKNTDAIKYAKKNITINKVLDKIDLIKGDSVNAPVYLKDKNIVADRIIMNLPFSAKKFFQYSLEMIGNIGFIHYYDIIHEEKIEDRIIELRKNAEKKGYTIEKTKVNKIKSYSPHEFYIGIDITAKSKNADVA